MASAKGLVGLMPVVQGRTARQTPWAGSVVRAPHDCLGASLRWLLHPHGDGWHVRHVLHDGSRGSDPRAAVLAAHLGDLRGLPRCIGRSDYSDSYSRGYGRCGSRGYDGDRPFIHASRCVAGQDQLATVSGRAMNLPAKPPAQPLRHLHHLRRLVVRREVSTSRCEYRNQDCKEHVSHDNLLAARMAAMGIQYSTTRHLSRPCIALSERMV